MSTPRAQANQSLYLAKILLSAWEQALSAEDTPALTLEQAFLPAVRTHLMQSYGWFLLEVTGFDVPPDGQPPRAVAQLPEIAAGKAIPGEVREFERLEGGGWLAALCSQDSASAIIIVVGAYLPCEI